MFRQRSGEGLPIHSVKDLTLLHSMDSHTKVLKEVLALLFQAPGCHTQPEEAVSGV